MIEGQWLSKLQGEFQKPYYKKLYETVREEYKHHTIFPPKEKLFRAYSLCPYEKLKVVILGQDPYHNFGQAQGLSFSVGKGIPVPPSLQNIFKELQEDIGCEIPKSGELDAWAKQGVLLLNTVLTVRAHEANSHRGIGWEEFTDATIRAIEEKEDPVQALSEIPGQGKEEMSFSIISKTIRKVLGKYGEELLRRSEAQGKYFLRTALKDYLRRARGIFVTEEQILIGSGAEHLYSLLAQILGRGQSFAVESPSYEKMQKIYEANGIELEFLEMGKKGIHSEALRKAKSRILHVTPFHSYPSGVTATAGKRREYLDYARRKNGFIIEDDYDSEFSALGKPEDSLFSMDERNSVYYINSFSKTIGPAFRMAYLLLPKERVEEELQKISIYSCSVPVLEQCLLTELLQGGEFERHINRIKRRRRNSATF